MAERSGQTIDEWLATLRAALRGGTIALVTGTGPRAGIVDGGPVDLGDPRPIIAARLDCDMFDLLFASGRAQTERLLNERVPEGAPWSADWHEPDRWGNVLTVKAGAVAAWLARRSGDAGRQ